jgi:hypothetical protein
LDYPAGAVTDVAHHVTRAPARLGMARLGESRLGDMLGATTITVTANTRGSAQPTTYTLGAIVDGVLQAYEEFAAMHPLANDE